MPADSEAAPHDALIERALAGDASAWDTLYRKHNPRVLGALLARRVPGWLAEELAHEAWWRLYRKQQEGTLRYLTVPGLAITTAVNLHLDHVRAPGESRRSDVFVDRDSAGPSSESVVLAREAVAQVAEILERESTRDQRIFWAVAVEGRPTKEVAAEYGLADITVRMLVTRIRAGLRTIDRGNP